MSFLKNNTYGITQQFEAFGKYDSLFEDIYYKGYTIIEDVLTKTEIDLFKMEINKS